MKSEKVYFARCSSYEPEGLRRALGLTLAPVLAAAGGAAGKSFLIKPNWLSWRRDEDPASHGVLAPAREQLRAEARGLLAEDEKIAVLKGYIRITALRVSGEKEEARARVLLLDLLKGIVIEYFEILPVIESRALKLPVVNGKA